MVRAKLLAAVGAIAVAVQPQAASAQASLSQEEISAMAVYAAPPALAAVRAKCARGLPTDGLLAVSGNDVAVRYAALAPQVWPSARRGLLKLAGTPSSQSVEERQLLATLGQLPDQAVRPLVDGLFVQKLTEAATPESCAKVERGISLLAPLDPSQAGAIAAFALTLARPEELPICEAEAP